MTRDVLDGIARVQVSGEPRELGILGVREGKVIAAFQLDADREVVAAFAPAPTRRARMPSSPLTGHELDQLPGTADEEMAGDLEVTQALVKGMCVRIQTVEEEIDDTGTPELPRRQADVVHH